MEIAHYCEFADLLDRSDALQKAVIEGRVGSQSGQRSRHHGPHLIRGTSEHFLYTRFAGIMASLDHQLDWLASLIAKVAEYHLCTDIECTTCGGGDPLKLLLAEFAGRSAGVPRPDFFTKRAVQWTVLRSAYFGIPRIAREMGRQLARVDFAAEDADRTVSFVLEVMWTAKLGELARVEFCAGFEGTRVEAMWGLITGVTRTRDLFGY
jgi:hypothetical protein